jgi:two-component system sensor histidine kinase/response regulator
MGTAAVGLVLIGIVSGYLSTHNASMASSQTVGDCSLLAAVLGGAVFCARASHRGRPDARGWRLLTVAFLCWTFGAAVTLFYGLTRNHHYPYPSIADIGFLSYPIPTLAALLGFPRPKVTLISSLRSALDAVVIALGVLFVSVSMVLDPVVQSLGKIDLAGVVMVAYPVIDVVICSVVLTLGMRQPAGQRLTWLLLGGGIVALAVTDGVYFELSARGGNAQTGGPVVVGWMVAALLVALASLAPRRQSEARKTRRFMRAVELIPYLPVLAGIIVIAGPGADRHAMVVLTGVLLLISVTIRQVMVVLENVALTDNLQKKVAELASLGSIVTSSRDAILGIDRAGTVVSANPAAEQVFGYTAAELNRSAAFNSPSRQQVLHQLIERSRRGEEIAVYDTEWTRPDGSIVQISMAISPIVHGDSFQGISLSGQDVTEKRLATAALERAREDALESSRMKSEFLATMSHEIRTPMNGVVGLTSLLLDTRLDEVQRQYAEGVHAAGDALLVVINDILDFSKLEAGRVELDPIDFDPRKMVDQVAALLAPPAFAKKLELLAYCLPDVPETLHGDVGRIRQILLNLASNAVKFTATGEVVIAVAAVHLNPGAARIRIEVRDTGIGIAEQGRERLFTSFSQADASTTRRYGGTGLGLAISNRLVEAMAGHIGLDSRLGTGSTFWFELPLAVGSTPAEPADPASDGLKGVRVLVVDDNATTRWILTAQLTAWDLVPEAAANAQTAIEMLRSRASMGSPYDIAVLDMCMPDVDGIQLAREISADADLQGTKLILLTSTVLVEPHDLQQAGIAEWLIKPARSSELHHRLVRLIRSPATPVAPAPVVTEPPPAHATSLGRVLIVEDNSLNQLVAEGIVSKLGYQVNIVANGAQALEALLSTSYAAVLMDCHMPVMDGFEATRQIRRRQDKNSAIPIIAMTAGAMAKDREDCLAAGMDDYIAKPVDLTTVSTVLRKWIITARLVSQPPLDLQRLEDLRQLGSTASGTLMSRMVDLFARDAPAALAAVVDAVRTREPERLKQAAHTLRGAASNIGAARVASLCLELEVGAGLLGPNRETELLEELGDELSVAMAALHDYQR